MAYYETGAATLAVGVCLGVLVFTLLKPNPRLQSVYRQYLVPGLVFLLKRVQFVDKIVVKLKLSLLTHPYSYTE